MGIFIGVGRILLTSQGCLPISEIGWSFSYVIHGLPVPGAFELVKKLLRDENGTRLLVSH